MNSVLIDTNIWIHHFKKPNEMLKDLLEKDEVLIHPFILGELALGQIQNRAEKMFLLNFLAKCPVLSEEELLTFIENRRLFGLGIGLVDASLLGSCLLTGAHLWTLDKALLCAAQKINLPHI